MVNMNFTNDTFVAFISKDSLCVLWAKIIGFIDNKPWWELEDGQRLVDYNDTSHYISEMSVPIIPRYIYKIKYIDFGFFDYILNLPILTHH